MELRSYTEQEREAFISLNICPINRQHMNGPHTRESAAKLFDSILTPTSGLKSRAVYMTEDYVGHIFATLDGERWELGFILDKAYWGKGLASMTCELFISEQLNGEKLFATVDEGHLPSIRILQKLGFKQKERCEDEFGVYYLYIR